MGNEVSQHAHVDRLECGVCLDKVKTLTIDNRKFGRGIKKAIYNRVMERSLNKDGGHYLRPAVWSTNLLKVRDQVPPPSPRFQDRH